MTEQLNLLGTADLPEDLGLGLVQREVMRELRRLGSITRDEAGAIAHSHRDKHCVDERCAFCPIDGALLVDSLLKRGLVDRGVDGAVRLPQLEPAVVVEDDIPY